MFFRPRAAGSKEQDPAYEITPLVVSARTKYAMGLTRKDNDMVQVSITVNGKVRKAHVEPRLLLAHFLREQLNLTGTHIGCDTSQCGACTVLIDGRSAKSCTLFAAQADGSQITTIEGLAKDGQLHPLQEGFWEEHGLQCGYCTPGMILSAANLLSENPKPTEEQIREGISGNFCRCTGYQHIVNAVQYAAGKR